MRESGAFGDSFLIKNIILMLHTKPVVLYFRHLLYCRMSHSYGVRNVKNTLKQHKNVEAALQI